MQEVISDETKYKKVVEGVSVQGYPNAEVILSLSTKMQEVLNLE